jgi:hypothetical protein
VALRCASGALMDGDRETETARKWPLLFEQPGPAVRIHLAPPNSRRNSSTLEIPLIEAENAARRDFGSTGEGRNAEDASGSGQQALFAAE